MKLVQGSSRAPFPCANAFMIVTLLLWSSHSVSGFASQLAATSRATILVATPSTCRRVGSLELQTAFRSSTSPSSTLLHESTAEPDNNTNQEHQQQHAVGTLRASLRKATGFSLTALRATCRAATGISLTAIYLTTVAATGNWIRQTTKFVLSIFPPWARYFVQPFLILYYVPIFILRNMTGPTRVRARKTHQAVLDSWKDAVQRADEKVAYWPIHVDDEGHFESDMNELDMREGVMESIQVAKEENDEESK